MKRSIAAVLCPLVLAMSAFAQRPGFQPPTNRAPTPQPKPSPSPRPPQPPPGPSPAQVAQQQAIERQRQAEAARQQQLAQERARQAAIEQQRRAEAERARQQAIEQQRRAAAERARQQAIEQQRRAEAERQRQLASEKARQQAEAQKARQQATERLRQQSLEQQRRAAADKARLADADRQRLAAAERARQQQEADRLRLQNGQPRQPQTLPGSKSPTPPSKASESKSFPPVKAPGVPLKAPEGKDSPAPKQPDKGPPPVPSKPLPTPKVPEGKSSTAKVPESKLPTPKVPDNKSSTPKAPESKLPTPKVPENKPSTPKVPESKLPTPKVPENKPSTPKVPESKLPTPKVPENKPFVPKVPENKLPTQKLPEGKPSTPKVADSKPFIPKVPDAKLPAAKVPDNKPSTSKVPDTKPTEPTIVQQKSRAELDRRIALNKTLPNAVDDARRLAQDQLSKLADKRPVLSNAGDQARLDQAQSRLREQLAKTLPPPKATEPTQPNKVVIVPGNIGAGVRTPIGPALNDAQSLALRNLARDNAAARALVERRVMRPADLVTLRGTLGSINDPQARLAVIKSTAPSFRLNDRHWLGLFEARTSVAFSVRERIVISRFIDGTPWVGDDIVVIRRCLGAPLPPFLRACIYRMIEEELYARTRLAFLNGFVTFGGPGCVILPVGGVVIYPGCVPTIPTVWIPADPTVVVAPGLPPQGAGFACTVVPDEQVAYVDQPAVEAPATAEVVLTPTEKAAFDDILKSAQKPDVLRTMTPEEIRKFLTDVYPSGLPNEAVAANDPSADLGTLAPDLKVAQSSRYLRFANNSKERVTLKVEVPTAPENKVDAPRKLEYKLEPGEVADLKDGDWRVNAAKVRFSVVTEKGKELNQFKDKDFVLVPEKDDKGEPSYQSATPEVAQIGIQGDEGAE
ncbi:MAG: hypothetical protein U0746_00765 [Gemmataceae bacterium]